MREKFTALIKKYNDLEKELSKLTSEAMEEELETIFQKYPSINSIGFTAYTPYWNDGSPCEYLINSDTESIVINGQNGYDEEDRSEEENNVADLFCNILEEIPAKIIQNSFEEGLTVFHRDGNITHSYVEHD